MKRPVYIILLFLLLVSKTSAEEIGGVIKLTGCSISSTEEVTTLRFRAEIPPKAVKRNHVIAFTPVVSDGINQAVFRTVVVEGQGSHVAQLRHEWAAGYPAFSGVPFITGNGTTVDYYAELTTEPWMNGSSLIVETELIGCCASAQLASLTLDNRLHLWDETNVEQPQPEDDDAPRTMADTLAVSFPFVADISRFEMDDLFSIYDGERDNSLAVYFEQGVSRISDTYMDNAQTLVNLISVVRMITGDPASNVHKIVVGGFASPEGSYEFNNRLAFERAATVKEYILQMTDILSEDILVHNGSVDWVGLRELVSDSSMPGRNEVLNIIDGTPIWDAQANKGRLGELMRLNGGQAYRYMYNEFFPYLRSGAFIRVFYENKY